MISDENIEKNVAYEAVPVPPVPKTVYRPRKEPLAFLEPLLLPVFLAAIVCTTINCVGFALVEWLPRIGLHGNFLPYFLSALSSLGYMLFSVSIVLGLAQISVRLTDIAKLLRSNRDDD